MFTNSSSGTWNQIFLCILPNQMELIRAVETLSKLGEGRISISLIFQIQRRRLIEGFLRKLRRVGDICDAGGRKEGRGWSLSNQLCLKGATITMAAEEGRSWMPPLDIYKIYRSQFGTSNCYLDIWLWRMFELPITLQSCWAGVDGVADVGGG